MAQQLLHGAQVGASRQQVVYEANHDLREVVQEILDATVPETAEAAGE